MNGCYDGFGTKWKKFLGFANRRPDCNWLPGAIPEPNWPGNYFFHIPEITMKRVPAEVRWRRDPILEQLGQFGCVFVNCLARRLGPLPAIVSPDVLTSVEHSSENVAVAVETHGYPQKLRQVS